MSFHLPCRPLKRPRLWTLGGRLGRRCARLHHSWRKVTRAGGVELRQVGKVRVGDFKKANLAVLAAEADGLLLEHHPVVRNGGHLRLNWAKLVWKRFAPRLPSRGSEYKHKREHKPRGCR